MHIFWRRSLHLAKDFFVLFLRNGTTRPSKKCLCSRNQTRLEKANTKPLSATLPPSPPTQHWGAHTPPALPRGSSCRRFTSPQPLHGLPSPMPPPPPLLHQGHLLPAPAPSSRTCTLLQLYMPGLPAPSCPHCSHLPPCSAPPAQKHLSLLRKVEAKQGQGRVRPPGKVLSATTKGPRLLHKRSSWELVVGRSAEAICREQHGCLSLCSLHFYTQSTPIRRQAHAFAVEFTRPGSQRCIAPTLLSWIYFL